MNKEDRERRIRSYLPPSEQGEMDAYIQEFIEEAQELVGLVNDELTMAKVKVASLGTIVCLLLAGAFVAMVILLEAH